MANIMCGTWTQQTPFTNMEGILDAVGQYCVAAALSSTHTMSCAHTCPIDAHINERTNDRTKECAHARMHQRTINLCRHIIII